MKKTRMRRVEIMLCFKDHRWQVEEYVFVPFTEPFMSSDAIGAFWQNNFVENNSKYVDLHCIKIYHYDSKPDQYFAGTLAWKIQNLLATPEGLKNWMERQEKDALFAVVGRPEYCPPAMYLQSKLAEYLKTLSVNFNVAPYFYGGSRKLAYRDEVFGRHLVDYPDWIDKHEDKLISFTKHRSSLQVTYAQALELLDFPSF